MNSCELCPEEALPHIPFCAQHFIEMKEAFTTVVDFIGRQEVQDAVNRNLDPGAGYRQGRTPRAEAADALMFLMISTESLSAGTSVMVDEWNWY